MKLFSKERGYSRLMLGIVLSQSCSNELLKVVENYGQWEISRKLWSVGNKQKIVFSGK